MNREEIKNTIMSRIAESNQNTNIISAYDNSADTLAKYKDLLDRMVKLALKRERENKNISYSFDTNILSGVKLGGVKGKL